MKLIVTISKLYASNCIVNSLIYGIADVRVKIDSLFLVLHSQKWDLHVLCLHG